MYKYVIKRILMMIPVMLGISFVVFSILEFTPGDPATLILGADADPAAIAELNQELGLDRPFLIRYADYIVSALHGDFGKSYTTRLPVFDEIMQRFPTTLIIALGATVLKVLIGVPLGVMSAVKQYTFIDYASSVFALVFTAMPSFWLGLMLMLVFSVWLGWIPPIGAEGLVNYIMPCFALALGSAATLVRMTRSTMLEVIRQDYIRTARAKGAKETKVVFEHALKNALLPIITIIGLNFSALLGGTMIIESVFAMAGLGTNTITAIRTKNTPMVMASILFIALLAGIINLVVDIIYAYVDPRIKSRYVKSKGKV